MTQVVNANRRAALLAAGEVVGGWGPAPPELDDRALATLRMADLFVAWLERSTPLVRPRRTPTRARTSHPVASSPHLAKAPRRV